MISAVYIVNYLLQKPLDSSEESFSPAPAGGGLLSAAIGVTRAVTQFLGAALQVCSLLSFLIKTRKINLNSLKGAGRSIQTAWSGQPTSSSTDNNYYRLSG